MEVVLIREKRNKPKKFAIIGTSCSGKTTLTYQILSELKRRGVNADGVIQQDRRLAFERWKLETEKEAQYWVILNMAKKEVEMQLNDVEVIVSDRSVLDFYAYLETMYGRDEMMWEFVKRWIDTYTAVYYLGPLPYENDGKRPSDEFRMKVDQKLRDLCLELIKEGKSNILKLEREKILGDILSRIGKRVLSDVDLHEVGVLLRTEGMKKVLIGGSYAFGRQTKDSDVDVYCLGKKIRRRKDLEEKLKRVFGVKFDVTEVDDRVYRYLKKQGFKEVGL